MFLKISSVILLVAIVSEVYCIKTGLSEEVDKCLESTISEDISTHYFENLNIKNLTENDRKILRCTMGCMVKHASAKDGKTMYQYFEEGLNRATDKTDVNVMTQQLSTCANVGDDTCKFIECLDKAGEHFKQRIDGWIKFVLSKNT